MKNYILILFLILNSFSFGKNRIDPILGVGNTPTVYVISIGINKYEKLTFDYAVSDSKSIVEKIKNDSIENPYSNKRPKTKYSRFSVYNLTDENATLPKIKNSLKEIITNAQDFDYFIFYFGGISFESKKNGFTYLATYGWDLNLLNTANSFSLVELSQFLEQIKCKNQLIISEAGVGEKFSQDLIKNLFESNVLISANTTRNRIIITTNGFGIESKEISGGYLVNYLKNNKIKILDVFKDINRFDFKLCKIEIENQFKNNTEYRYSAIYSENKYRQILLNNKTLSRGSNATDTRLEKKKENNTISKTHALLIATNNYESSKEWNTLKNPINDANSVAELLENKYNVTVSKQYNKSYKEVLEEIIRIKNVMNENDKFIFFVAGHGYYSDNLSDGFLVLKDSKETTDDFSLNSYLSMATLQRLLDNMPSKNIFAIFDVCFGLTFDPLSKDLALSDVKNISKDISLDEFITRKNEKISRIFLASGRYEVPDYWSNSLNHSPFADKLIKSLNSETDFINPSKIYSALEGNITQPFLKQFGKHDERGDFLLKVN
jgi:hypothetical protein